MIDASYRMGSDVVSRADNRPLVSRWADLSCPKTMGIVLLVTWKEWKEWKGSFLGSIDIFQGKWCSWWAGSRKMGVQATDLSVQRIRVNLST